MREAWNGLRLKAPAAPDSRSEELFLDAGGGRQVRVIVYYPKQAQRTGGLLWMFGGAMVMGKPEINDAPNRYLRSEPAASW